MIANIGRVGAAISGIDPGPVSKDWFLDERNGVNFLVLVQGLSIGFKYRA